jgi:NADH-quinone oxidoreductase subunit N
MVRVTKISKEGSFNLSIYSLVVAFLLSLLHFEDLGKFGEATMLDGFIYADGFSGVLTSLFLALGLLSILITRYYFKIYDLFKAEFFIMFFLALFGMLFLANSSELITSFVALEIVSISIYTLVAFKKDITATEAVLKYFILGSFVGAFYVMGSSFIFGEVGSTKLIEISNYISTHKIEEMPLLASGMLMILVALLFKVTAAPFHTWSIDVYSGATLPITAFMNSAVKLASFAFLVRILSGAFEEVHYIYQPILFYVAIATMFIGNIMSFKQESVRKMLISSSIVHSGYLLVAIGSINNFSSYSIAPVIFYLFSYTLAIGGVFFILTSISRDDSRFLLFDDFKGLSRVRPFVALAMTIFMLTFIGFPFTMGFVAKFHLFTTAAENGFIYLALFGIINTILSVYYYLRLTINMYFFQAKEKFDFDTSKTFILSITVIILTIIAGGFGVISIEDFIAIL